MPLKIAEDNSFSIMRHFWQIAPARERRSRLPACTQFFRVYRLSCLYLCKYR
jgi:hypothetical protein